MKIIDQLVEEMTKRLCKRPTLQYFISRGALMPQFKTSKKTKSPLMDKEVLAALHWR